MLLEIATITGQEVWAFITVGGFSSRLGELLLYGLIFVVLATNFYLLIAWRREHSRLSRLADTLGERNLLLQAMQEATPEGFVAVAADGYIIAHNQRFVDMWGIPPKIIANGHRQVVGGYLDTLVFDPNTIREQIEQAYADPEMSFRRETHLKDGRIFQAHTAPLPDLHGVGVGRVWYYRDITTLRDLEQQTRQRGERLEAAIEVLADGFVLYDAEDRLVRCNQAFAELYQRQPAELTGLSHETILRDAHQRGVGPNPGEHSFEDWLGRLMQGRRRCNHRQLEFRSHDGRWFLVSEKLTASSELVQVRTDITRQKRQEAELRRLATTDSLTGALNHGQFMRQADAELRRAQRYHHDITLLMLDADHFKQVNDQHGHGAGDAVLRRIVEILQAGLRDSDLTGRLGGEEFAVLLPQTDTPATLLVAERLREQLAGQYFDGTAGHFQVTVSMGIASLAPQDRNLDDLFKRADRALYRAKRSGRNQVCIAPPNDIDAPQTPLPPATTAPPDG